MVYKVFDKETRLGASVNEELAQELHKLAIKNFERRKFCAMYIKIKYNLGNKFS